MLDFSNAFQIKASNLDEIFDLLNFFTKELQPLVLQEIKEDIFKQAIAYLDNITLFQKVHPLGQPRKNNCLEESKYSMENHLFNAESSKNYKKYDSSIDVIRYKENYYIFFHGLESLRIFLEKQTWVIPQYYSMKLLTDKIINQEQYQQRAKFWHEFSTQIDVELNFLSKTIYHLSFNGYNDIVQNLNQQDFQEFMTNHADWFEKRVAKYQFWISLNTKPEIKKMSQNTIELKAWLESTLVKADYNLLQLPFNELELLIKEKILLNESIKNNNNKNHNQIKL